MEVDHVVEDADLAVGLTVLGLLRLSYSLVEDLGEHVNHLVRVPGRRSLRSGHPEARALLRSELGQTGHINGGWLGDLHAALE
ncbi:uncharacterized protein KRP23_3393 [Phytophthora ramorum]|uniref:uncharacterized protein n=1 Tax=Phytophthora ramorum TaxID=164328 RepID=UPI0030ACC93F|nr:hypothetical protein KRP23_3393 [Phytophthora ramorum]